MPSAPKQHKPRTLKPKCLTLKQRQGARTLALNGAAWQRLRRLVLTEQPLCPECQKQGLLVTAIDVDHIDNDPSNNERSNLVGLCHPHHSAKTRAWMNGGRRVVRGCDANGSPLDPAHPWSIADCCNK
jgi:5-methylcytosine-specific restriction enzyme A